jgi:hypothetical protein
MQQGHLAIERAGRALRLNPRAHARGSSFLIGAALFFSRRFEEAVPRLRAITPEAIPNYPLPFRDPRHRELYFSGLRLAVGEET